MKFTIYRGSWRRGGSYFDKTLGQTMLLNSHNLMCCLGQIEHQRGVPLDLLRNIFDPEVLHDTLGLTNRRFGRDDFLLDENGDHSALSHTAMPINDDQRIDDYTREHRLKTQFLIAGHELEFVDGVAPWFKEEVAA